MPIPPTPRGIRHEHRLEEAARESAIRSSRSFSSNLAYLPIFRGDRGSETNGMIVSVLYAVDRIRQYSYSDTVRPKIPPRWTSRAISMALRPFKSLSCGRASGDDPRLKRPLGMVPDRDEQCPTSKIRPLLHVRRSEAVPPMLYQRIGSNSRTTRCRRQIAISTVVDTSHYGSIISPGLYIPPFSPCAQASSYSLLSLAMKYHVIRNPFVMRVRDAVHRCRMDSVLSQPEGGLQGLFPLVGQLTFMPSLP